VSEVGFGGHVFVQSAESRSILSAVEAGLAGLALTSLPPVPASSIKPGEQVAAKFSADGLWYRARVLSKASDGGARCRFSDYGNEENVAAADIRRPTGAVGFMSKPPAATEVALADVVVPDKEEPFAYEAGECIRDICFGKKVEVVVRANAGPGKVIGDLRILTVAQAGPPAKSSPSADADEGLTPPTPPASPPPKQSLTELLLQSGAARVIRKSDKVSRAAYSRLSPFEKVGQQSRAFNWQYGDCYASDEDDDDETKERRARRY
jgi:Tudor domain